VTVAPGGAATEARIGDAWDTIDTPALIVDLDRLEANIAAMADHARRGGVALRPHVKTHKSVAIARRQLDAGAVGLTVAKLDEVEALVDGGIDTSILLAYQIVAAPKLARTIDLAARTRLTVAVDSVEGARRLAAAASAAGLTLEVWVEIDSGLARCGVVPADAPALARVIADLDGLRLTGMFTHAGQSYGASSPAEVEAIAEAEARAVVDAAFATRAMGIDVETISAGSTPTARFLDAASGLTEIRPGTYVFYDALQVALGSAAPDQCALTIATTVISRPAPDRAVVDAGSKTFGLDKGAHSSSLLDDYGTLVGAEGRLNRLSEEHGTLDVPAGAAPAIGDRLRFIPNHVCSTANLGRRFYGVRAGIVEAIITIDASGGVH
jgi:D-serine deaminase-like pyridoxal phosphate-dependent protein